MTVKVFAVHGINTPSNDVWPGEWQESLGDGFEVTPARWEATGSGIRDIARMVLNSRFRRRQVASIAQQLKTFWLKNAGRHECIAISHSMGQPITMAAERLLWSRGEGTQLQHICMGGPLTNPAFSRVLDMVGLSGPIHNTPVFIFNADDGVCASKTGVVTLPSWADCRRISVPNIDPGYSREHGHSLYLEHPVTRRALGELKN